MLNKTTVNTSLNCMGASTYGFFKSTLSMGHVFNQMGICVLSYIQILYCAQVGDPNLPTGSRVNCILFSPNVTKDMGNGKQSQTHELPLFIEYTYLENVTCMLPVLGHFK